MTSIGIIANGERRSLELATSTLLNSFHLIPRCIRGLNQSQLDDFGEGFRGGDAPD